MKIIRNYLPDRIKRIIRFCRYKNERKKVFREKRIRKAQDNLIIKNFPLTTKRLIVFFVEGADWFTGTERMSGGILSIASIYEETVKLKNIHNAEVIMVSYPDAHLLLQHKEFPNNITVYRYEQLFSHFNCLDFLLIHSICYRTPRFIKSYLMDNKQVARIPDFRINVLNQNIKLMPPPEEFVPLKQLTKKVSQTTAHKKYSTKEVRDLYGFPLHYLSVFGSPEKYNRKPYQEKENLILLSPDQSDFKEDLIKKLKAQFPEYSVEVVRNLKYTEYLDKISKSKFMITLGEGLDFYFLEQVFSGGVSFAIFNLDFFPHDFKETTGIFPDAESLLKEIVGCIHKLDKKEAEYTKASNEQHGQCSKHYKYDEYRGNLEKFYLGQYTYE